jgi:Domain of unknown function (DUF892)
MPGKPLNDLFYDTLRDIYFAEGQILKTLPRLTKAARSEELKAAFLTHRDETEGHVERLQQVFEIIGKPARAKTCEAIKGILKEGSWLDGLVKGIIWDIAELSARHNRSERSIRQTLSMVFLDPALIDAACSGALPRGYGVTRLMDLPPRFADQWRALGLQRPA